MVILISSETVWKVIFNQQLGFRGITDIEFIHAEGFDSGDEARSLAISNAESAIKAAISMPKSLQRA